MTSSRAHAHEQHAGFETLALVMPISASLGR
jgi:hypothetical protein